MSAVRIIAKAVLKLKRCDRKRLVALAGSARPYQFSPLGSVCLEQSLFTKLTPKLDSYNELKCQVYCNNCLHCVIFRYISIARYSIVVRGQVIEEGGRANVYAVEPKMYADDTQQFGFNEHAEMLNGRLAIIGFVSLLVLEIATGHGVIGWLTGL